MRDWRTRTGPAGGDDLKRCMTPCIYVPGRHWIILFSTWSSGALFGNIALKF
jgi:hypothetical protein